MREGDEAAIRVMMMPKDTNAVGSIFGGVILAHIDLAGAVEAKRHTPNMVVTVAMDEVVFKQPVFVGDLVSFYAHTLRRGRTSVTVQVRVFADRREGGRNARLAVTEAQVTYVAVDGQRRPVPLI